MRFMTAIKNKIAIGQTMPSYALVLSSSLSRKNIDIDSIGKCLVLDYY